MFIKARGWRKKLNDEGRKQGKERQINEGKEGRSVNTDSFPDHPMKMDGFMRRKRSGLCNLQ